MTIWKFPLEATDEQTIYVPRGAKILSVRTQGETPCLWALVDPDAEKEPTAVRIYGTGHDVPDDPGEFVGTVFLHGGSLVFHVFVGEVDA